MVSNIVTESGLMEGFDIKQLSALIHYMAMKGIPFEKTPFGKVWTVHRALDEHIVVPHKIAFDNIGLRFQSIYSARYL